MINSSFVHGSKQLRKKGKLQWRMVSIFMLKRLFFLVEVIQLASIIFKFDQKNFKTKFFRFSAVETDFK